MKITSVKLKEFGRHELLDLDMNAGVVGVVGVNGCGKSTFLKAIEFAFTGLLADAAETYVRNVGSSESASNASVELTFVKHGIEGKIFRQIGKTTKRLLTWNGTDYKSAADVENCIREIIGADKQALSNAVFISQGELDRLLFGGQVEREQLFIKLLLLSHLEKVADTVVKDQIKGLIGGTTNFDAVLEEIAAQEADASANALSLGETLKTSPDQSQTLQAATELLEAQKTLGYQENQLADAMRNKREAETRLQTAMGAAQFADLGAVESEIEKQSALAAVLEQKMQGATSRSELEARARIARTSLDNLETQAKSECTFREEALRNQLPDEYSRKLREFIASRELSVKLNTESESLSEQLRPLMRDEANLQAWIRDEGLPEATALREKKAQDLKELRERCSDLKLKITVMEPTLKTAHADCELLECPVCERPLIPGFISEEKMAKLKEDFTAATTACEALETELQDKETTFRGAVGRVNILGVQIKGISDRLTETVQKLEAAEAVSADCSHEEAKVKLAAHDKATSHLLVYTEKRRLDLETQITSAKAQVQSLDKELAETPDITPEAQAELTVRIANTQTRLSKATQLRAAALRFQATIETSEKSVTELTAQIEKTAADRDEKTSKMFRVTASVPHLANTVESVQTLVDGLAAMQQKRAVLEGQVKQAADALAAIIVRKKDVESRVAKEKFKKDLAVQLEILVSTFGRKGLPLKYVNYRFSQLVELTAANLSTLGANFTVVPDEDKAVSFRFKRLDDVEEFYMGQEKLSGGQRVRLTVAFLLAVQQLIIPDVGLLILDEPSVHLDQEGTESLAEMLASMGEQLHDGEAQVIVCDHNTALEPAFQKLVRLGN